MDHRTREFVTHWARDKAIRTGRPQALVLNKAMDVYMYEDPERWEATKHTRPSCILVEIIQPWNSALALATVTRYCNCMEDLNKRFGLQVWKRRVELDLSQREVGNRFDPPMDKGRISLVERGKANVSLRIVQRFAKALNCTPLSLLR